MDTTVISNNDFHDRIGGFEFYTCRNCNNDWIIKSSKFNFCPVCGVSIIWNLV